MVKPSTPTSTNEKKQLTDGQSKTPSTVSVNPTKQVNAKQTATNYAHSSGSNNRSTIKSKKITAKIQEFINETWITIKKWLLRTLILAIFPGIGYIVYQFDLWQYLIELTPSKQSTSANSLLQKQAATQQQIDQLQQTMDDVTRQLELEQQKNFKQQQQLVLELQNQQQRHQRQLVVMNQQLANINGQFNRWKTQLNQPEKLLDSVLNNLHLIQKQSILNYSPATVAQQLSTVDSMLADINIDELSLARLEIQQLIDELDNKPNPPIAFWLQQIDLAKQSTYLWINQQRQLRKDNRQDEMTSLSTFHSNNRMDSSASEPIESLNQAWYESFWNHLLRRMQSSLTIGKNTQNPSHQSIEIPVSNGTIDPLLLKEQLDQRLDMLSISLLSNHWDKLRLQSLELNKWIEENLSQVNTGLSDTLAMMSVYKPEKVTVSLARSIRLIEDYQINQQAFIEPVHSSTTDTSKN